MNQKYCALKITSLILAIIGTITMFFVNGAFSLILFIAGIICGCIYKTKTKSKCFTITLNIIGLIINIILIIIVGFKIQNTMNNTVYTAQCTEQGGYIKDGKCILK